VVGDQSLKTEATRATGSSLLQLFGYKDPGDVASWLTGVALWMLAGLAILVLAAF
jgi:hypothetical protein